MNLKLDKMQGMLYLSRFLSALVLFILIAKANVWVDTLSNTILVLGYRFFIIFAPFFLVFGHRNIAPVCFALAGVGVFLWLHAYYVLGAILIAIGMAVGGYVLKFHAAKTPGGAAGNKISLNVGSFLSGISIAAFAVEKADFLSLLLGILGIVTLVSLITRKMHIEVTAQHQNGFSIKSFFSMRGVAWSLAGIAIGIKIIGIFSILPQYLIKSTGHLPGWYGFAIALNALVVIFLQAPIMAFAKKLSLYQGLFFLLLGMVIVGLPGLFMVNYLAGAIIWTLLLSLIECVITYLDTIAVHDGGLLPKESCWGVGSALTVLLMRGLPISFSAELIGGIGVIAVIVSMLIFKAIGAGNAHRENA